MTHPAAAGGVAEECAAASPTRAEATSILERGQRDWAFPDVLPAPVLAAALEAFAIALLETPSPGPGGEAGATAMLIAAGVAPVMARARVRDILGEAADRE